MDSPNNHEPLEPFEGTSRAPEPQPLDARLGGRLDVTSGPAGDPGAEANRPSRPFLGIQFRCCRSYGRIYRNSAATAYEGSCPRCGRRVKVPIGPGGKGSRFFSAG